MAAAGEAEDDELSVEGERGLEDAVFRGAELDDEVEGEALEGGEPALFAEAEAEEIGAGHRGGAWRVPDAFGDVEEGEAGVPPAGEEGGVVEGAAGAGGEIDEVEDVPDVDFGLGSDGDFGTDDEDGHGGEAEDFFGK